MPPTINQERLWECGSSRPRRLRAGRIRSVGRQHIGPEAVEGLLGQFEEDVRLSPLGRSLRAAGGRGHDRHPHAVHAQVNRGEQQAHGTPGARGGDQRFRRSSPSAERNGFRCSGATKKKTGSGNPFKPRAIVSYFQYAGTLWLLFGNLVRHYVRAPPKSNNDARGMDGHECQLTRWMCRSCQFRGMY